MKTSKNFVGFIIASDILTGQPIVFDLFFFCLYKPGVNNMTLGLFSYSFQDDKMSVSPMRPGGSPYV